VKNGFFFLILVAAGPKNPSWGQIWPVFGKSRKNTFFTDFREKRVFPEKRDFLIKKDVFSSKKLVLGHFWRKLTFR